MSVASNDTFSTNESFTFTTNDPNIQIIWNHIHDII
jgi:hypothetical protein